MNRLRCVMFTVLLCACGGSSTEPDPDPRDAILNGDSEASSATHWYSSQQYRIAIFRDGTCVQQGGLVGNGTRRACTWTKVAPDLIFMDTPGGTTCYIATLRAISGSFQSGSFSAQQDEVAGCNTGFRREFILTGGHVP